MIGKKTSPILNDFPRIGSPMPFLEASRLFPSVSVLKMVPQGSRSPMKTRSGISVVGACGHLGAQVPTETTFWSPPGVRRARFTICHS